MSQAAAIARAPQSQWLTVRLGGQLFAIDILRVRELRGYSALAPVPQSPAYVLGLLDLRGTVIAVIDLALRLDLPAIDAGPTSVIVVVAAPRGLVGLLVDQVCDLLTIADDALHFPPLPAREPNRRFVSGAAVVDSGVINILCTENIVEMEAQ